MVETKLERAKRLTRQHDIITLVPITALFAATIYTYLTRDVSADEDAQRDKPGVHPAPIYWWLSVGAGVYSVLDILYIVIEPLVTQRYWQIILHHIAVITMVSITLESDTTSMTPTALLVELNTLILTVQKLFKIKWLTVPMLITWFFLRLVWYPILTYISFKYYSHPRLAGYHWWLQAISFAVLNGLNVFWSAEFAFPKKGGKGSMQRKDA